MSGTARGTYRARPDGKGRNVIGQGILAILRAFLVASLIALPALMLPGADPEMAQMIALVGLLVGGLVFAEYRSSYPSFIEFRSAPPYNRMRFAMGFAIVAGVTVVCAGKAGPLAAALGTALDFPFSPVRLMLLVLPADAPAADAAVIRTAAALAYALSLGAVCLFVPILRLVDWPLRNGAFNVWVNLPMFDPTAGGDILRRMKREAHVNVALGFLMPFLVPALLLVAPSGPSLLRLEEPQTVTWVIALWGILPAGLIMRGIALIRISDLIAEKRRRAYRQANLSVA
jgi:hypothetical protein